MKIYELLDDFIFDSNEEMLRLKDGLYGPDLLLDYGFEKVGDFWEINRLESINARSQVHNFAAFEFGAMHEKHQEYEKE